MPLYDDEFEYGSLNSEEKEEKPDLWRPDERVEEAIAPVFWCAGIGIELAPWQVLCPTPQTYRSTSHQPSVTSLPKAEEG